MTQGFRTETGGRIDRARPFQFSFDGRMYQGFAGDTLASALLANGVHLVGRSFKYHRPRGILAAGSEEPNALVTLDEGPGRVTPNLRATQIPLYDGLRARSQNRWPSLHLDAGAAASFLAPLLGAGFYYKSFKWPASWWKRHYEPRIRRAAGLGHAPRAADPDRYLHQHAHCDMLVIGAGPAGLAAALAAAEAGAQVILCDEQNEPGGFLLSAPNVTIDGLAGPDWVADALTRLHERVAILPRTTAFGWFPGDLIGLAQVIPSRGGVLRERLWQVRAEQVVLATGAIERPLVFPGNDRPGVMLAGAALTYLNRFGVRPGRRAVVACADDSAWLAAMTLYAGGVAIAAIIDQRRDPQGEVIETARALGIPTHVNATVTGTTGRLRVSGVRVSTGAFIPCDTVLMSGGWTPAVHLASQSRQGLRFDPASGAWLPTANTAGACAGTVDLAACLRDGAALGGGPRAFDVSGWPVMAPGEPPRPAPPHPKAFVDLQNDVTTRDLEIATQEGFVAIEHIKRYTTTGMATDQGKTSNLNALMTVAALTGHPPEALGLTTFRPPYTPVTFGAFASAFRDELYAPIRLSPIAAPDAVLEDVGLWKRARCFPRAGETPEAAALREAECVRQDVGMLDASTLGKIEVSGPGAGAFLDRIYTGRFSNLRLGQCRYALLLTEDGFIRDDGIVTRIGAERFHVTTTTGGLGFVLHHMEDYLQTEFATLRAWLTDVTEHWAVIAVQGPRAAEVLAAFVQDIDLSRMPHMSMQEGHFGPIPIRLFRVSFTGEQGFEINLPPDEAQRVWDTLLARGVTRYGTDAMHMLRAGKGYIVVGQDTDGTVTPDDVGLSWTIARDKPDFIGKRSLSLPELSRPGRKQLVGLASDVALEEGAQLVFPGESLPVGHVTSAYPGVALGLVEDGRARIGQMLEAPMPDGRIGVVVTDPVTHDKAGERLRPGPVRSQPALPILPPAPQASLPALEGDGVRMVELAPVTLLSLRADAAAGGIGMALGVLLPTVPCRSMIARDRAALWLGPDEWLVEAPDAPRELIEAARKGAGRQPCAITDVSHRVRKLEIAGPHAAWCLNAFCALDLDLRAFPAGACTRTLLGKAEVVLWRLTPMVFHIHAGRSFFPYVWSCLEQAVAGLGAA